MVDVEMLSDGLSNLHTVSWNRKNRDECEESINMQQH
jgi:hypothetical protein